MGGRKAAWVMEEVRTVSLQEDKSLGQGNDLVVKRSVTVCKVQTLLQAFNVKADMQRAEMPF